jgi:pyrroline-5-carboxylate reductase
MLLYRMQIMGVPANLISVCDSDPERAKSAAMPMDARVFDLANPSGCKADVWLLCTGPKTILSVLKSLAPWLKPGQVVISFTAAGAKKKIEGLQEKIVQEYF